MGLAFLIKISKWFKLKVSQNIWTKIISVWVVVLEASSWEVTVVAVVVD